MSKTILVNGLRYNHESIVDLMLQHPDWNQNKLSEVLNCSAARLSTVINTELFKDYYARRRLEHSKEVSHGIANHVSILAQQALEKMKDIIEDEEVSPRLVLDTVSVTTKAMGMGVSNGSSQAAQNVQVNLNVDAQLLARARERLRVNQEVREEGVSVIPGPQIQHPQESPVRPVIEVIPQEV